MTESVNKPNRLNGSGNFQSEDAVHGRTRLRCRPSQTVNQPLQHLESKFVDLQTRIVNLGTLIGRSGGILDMLKLLESRFSGKSVRMISGKAADHKLFWI